jgi:1,2-diacylglycerol 3-alpha-glucosyltransferase
VIVTEPARLRVAIMFVNIGGYHAARLRAAHAVCQARGWDFTALQVTDWTFQHPWGDLRNEITFPLDTLLSSARAEDDIIQSGLRNVDESLITRWLDGIRPDVLALPGWGFPVTRMALQWCRRRGVQRIVMSETKWDDEPRRWWKEALKSVFYVRHFGSAIVSGEQHKAYLVRLGLSPERIFVGYSAVDNGYFAKGAQIARTDTEEARARWPAIPRHPYFLSMTRLLPKKNVDTMIRAYGAYRSAVAPALPWELVICGSGGDEPRLRALVAELGMADCVRLPGFVPYDALGSWYGLAGAFVHPATVEPWGLVINEACAAGLPILCSKTVGACDALVLEGQNGLKFDPRDPAAIARALVATHQMSPERRTEMGRSSQQIVAEYGADRFGSALAAAIDAGARSHRRSSTARLAE